MGITVKFSALIFLIFLAGGCANKTMVVLAPDQDGKTGAISVGNKAGEIVINSPYQATTIASTNEMPTAPSPLGKEKTDLIFKEALSIQPKKPIHFLLYFERETTLTSDSIKLVPEIMAAIQDRNSSDISIVGHTDTVGSKQYNTVLSLNRAAAVKDILVRSGVNPNTIGLTSHGKENPLVPTGDNVNEPKNRRVEVVVR
jgi:outer membrane protein OmpA-like peptidoglycan-associated protein